MTKREQIIEILVNKSRWSDEHGHDIVFDIQFSMIADAILALFEAKEKKTSWRDFTMTEKIEQKESKGDLREEFKQKLAIEIIARFSTKTGRGTPIARNNFIDGAEWGYAQQPQKVEQGRWIDVNDRLPEESCSVIVATDQKGIGNMWYDNLLKWHALKNGAKVTHWMPLPEHPSIILVEQEEEFPEINFRRDIAEELSRDELIERLCDMHKSYSEMRKEWFDKVHMSEQEEEKPTDERSILIKFLEFKDNINMAGYAEPEDIVDRYLIKRINK